MVKTLVKVNLRVQDKTEAISVRSYEPEEFEADTTEDRPIALLGERRRQFLAGLELRQKETDALAGE